MLPENYSSELKRRSKPIKHALNELGRTSIIAN